MKPNQNAFIVIAVIMTLGNTWAQYKQRVNYNAKFEPAQSILHGAGQSDGLSFSVYSGITGPDRQPVFYMDYTSAHDTPEKQRREVANWKSWLDGYAADVGLQIGLNFSKTGDTENVINGEYDPGLETLASELNALGRRVFLRIGYEANGFWNDYEPAGYKAAFIHIAELMRRESDLIATVWCIHPMDNLSRLLEFYPGDGVVDWWSVDLFEKKHLNSSKTKDFLQEAERREKPVLIGESTPTGVGVQTGLDSWDEWYGPYFNLIQAYPVIKGFSYINRDWAYLGGQRSWGNARLEHNTELACRYNEEISDPIFRHASKGASQTVIAAAQSTYARESEPDKTFHTEDKLVVLSEPDDSVQSFIQFDLEDISPGSNILAARLWLLGKNASSEDITISITGVAQDNWSETQLTWNTRPGIEQNALGRLEINDNGKTKIKHLDVTDYVASAIASGVQQISFQAADPSLGAATVELHSDNFKDGYPPYLQIVHDGPWWSAVDCDQVDIRNEQPTVIRGGDSARLDPYSNTSLSSRDRVLPGREIYTLRGRRVAPAEHRKKASFTVVIPPREAP